MTVKAVWHIVKESAKSIGVAKLAPHDLRRACARLCHASGGELEQIQFLLGHVSVQNDRTLPWGASSEFDQPSMIALGSSRTLDVAALVVEGLPTTRPEVSYPLHIDQWQILIARARFARCTSK